jgi:thioredoxin-dependent peroxiredoxin
LRDKADEFGAADCIVLGASFDTLAENKEFAQAQAFGFPLLSDVDRRVGQTYEVVRGADDQYAEFPLRISYLIDPEGAVRRSYPVADVASHAEQVLRDLSVLRTAS